MRIMDFKDSKDFKDSYDSKDSKDAICLRDYGNFMIGREFLLNKNKK